MKYLSRAILTACVMAAPVPAFAADNLECMLGNYSADQDAVINKYIAEFELADMDQDLAPDEVMSVIDERMVPCAAMHEWSEEASEAAGLYRLSDLTIKAIAQKHPNAAEILRRVETDLSAEESTRFWQIMESVTTDGGAEPTDDDFYFIGIIMLRFQPDADEELQNSFGALAGMKVLMRSVEATFSEL